MNKRAIEASDNQRPIPDIRTGDIVELKVVMWSYLLMFLLMMNLFSVLCYQMFLKVSLCAVCVLVCRKGGIGGGWPVTEVL